MSNPTVTIANTVPEPTDPNVERDTYSRIVYDQQKFFLYGEGEFDPAYASYDPTDQGQAFFILVPLDDALATVKPDFVAQDVWDETLFKAPSGFVAATNSVMPKIFVPSDILVDNGLNATGDKMKAFNPDDLTEDLFNWTVVGVSLDSIFEYAQIGPSPGSQYVSVKYKDDDAASSTVTLRLESPASPPTGNWETSDELVVTGAFCLMLNVVQNQPGTADPAETKNNPWTIGIAFGAVEMTINDGGSMEVKLTGGDADNTQTVNLAEGKSKGGPSQQKHVTEGTSYVILVYPTWNGLVVASGIQDSPSVVFTSSTFVYYRKTASILNAPYSTGFDPTAPAEVLVDVGAGVTSVLPSFGTQMDVTVKNCRLDLAYLPCFFSAQCWFDEWFAASDDTPDTEYEYTMYPIWTKNGTATTLDAPTVNDTTYPGPVADTSYRYVKWRMRQALPNRHGGQLFGEILRVNEDRDFPVKNGNGNFVLTWAGGTPADPSPAADWWNYITQLSVSVGIDDSSGSISVDKFGVAGQDAEPVQSIGGITIDATGGFGTVAGRIFTGLAMGVSDNDSVDGATWTIPLVGLEKKLDDIALVFAPFFDGDSLSKAFTFLAKYAGIIPDFSFAPSAVFQDLSVSDDINVARFDWKTGTSVRSALDEIMQDTNYNYVVRDGRIYLYELGGLTGLPVILGPDRSAGYDDTVIVSYDTTPDFEDLRNQIVVVGLQKVPDGQNTSLEELPIFPRIELRSNSTVPDVPWAKAIVKPISGFMSSSEYGDIADNIQSATKVYQLVGRTTIAGNADIKPYDMWGSDLVIYSVTHNMDFQAKTWTTDLEFMRTT